MNRMPFPQRAGAGRPGIRLPFRRSRFHVIPAFLWRSARPPGLVNARIHSRRVRHSARLTVTDCDRNGGIAVTELPSSAWLTSLADAHRPCGGHVEFWVRSGDAGVHARGLWLVLLSLAGKGVNFGEHAGGLGCADLLEYL